jgi:hypothetical protein
MTYSECMSAALVAKYRKRKRRVMLLSEACLAVPHFATLSHKQHDFLNKVTEHNLCTLIFSTTFVRNIFHSTKNSVKYHTCITSPCKVPVDLVRF